MVGWGYEYSFGNIWKGCHHFGYGILTYDDRNLVVLFFQGFKLFKDGFEDKGVVLLIEVFELI